MRKRLLIIFLAFATLPLAAQEPGGEFPELSVDSTGSRSGDFTVNDYLSLGVNYGASFSRMLFNPSVNQAWRFSTNYASVIFTKHLRLFGYMPYFGYQIGLAYGHEGYKFKENKETGYMHRIEGAEEAVFELVEVPVLSYFHFDMEHFKLEANLGPYVGYRHSITRMGGSVSAALKNSFTDYDIRWDYGLEGGLGFALVFEPVEFHVNALLRYSWSSIYEPNSSPSSYKEYYYRFAYPFDVNVTAGISIQLSRRSGKTNRMLRQEARKIVEQSYKDSEENGNASSKGRQ